MLFKASPAFAVCSSNNVLSFLAAPAHHPSITSPPSRRRSLDTASQPRRQTSRCYATVHNSRNEQSATGKGRSGPPAWPTCANPTPYDVFAIDRSAPYAKSRFAELVKLYHPDKHHAAALDALPAHTRLERYRLVVLANDILSSPDKRRAYDSWGAGWLGDGRAADDINAVYRKADRAWRRTPNNAGMNATWEDWERWHDRNNGGEKQSPVFMSNAAFAALVLAALAVGTVAQTTRMDNNSAIMIEKRQLHDMNIADALRRQGQAVAGKGREERIERFLRERENMNYDFVPAKLDAGKESNPK
ncbi:J domain-containing protein 1 [Colletotrichum musicola]|uniref:J domain-containing protein 1 n=1 Tax=Colletotrichum musicola TaxID=2175873 RepID=A0A8H6N2H6_9PEZI|nr:J domain-containing protein 1 [Colletotrichum musicola]